MSVARQIEREEGRVIHAYQDHLGYWTIGVGFLIDRRKGGGIPDEVIDFWLDFEISKKIKELRENIDFFDELSQPRQDALVNMAYQLGVSGLLRFKKMLAAMRAGDFEGAARQGVDSQWALQTPARAHRITEQIRTGEIQ